MCEFVIKINIQTPYVPEPFIVDKNCILKSNPKYNILSFNQLIELKKLDEKTLKTQWNKLVKMSPEKNKRTFVGNKILYHFQFKELLRTYRDVKNYKTLEDIFNDPTLSKKWIDQSIKINRNTKKIYLTSMDIFECYRRCKGSVVFFKPFTTKYLCSHFKATSVLDPCAGWGGRLLGARSLKLDYTGIDTNINLKENYDKMIALYGGHMIYKNCLDVDFKDIDYDFVITSPPYLNIEKYANMKLFIDEDDYYKNFLIPLINKCVKNIKIINNKPSYVCINISDYIYKKYLSYKGKPCDKKIDLQQQMGGKPNKEIIYIWSILN